MPASIVFADIHINTSKFPDYEQRKIQLMLDAIRKHNCEKVVLSGDIFDKIRPSLQDISLFYSFIDSIPSVMQVDIIAGNHDYNVFDYLPHTRFTYYSSITKIGNTTYIPWAEIHNFTEDHFDLTGLCYSHARCTIIPHIVEEVDISKFSQGFKLTILGDIHQVYEPFHNVIYTSSPVPIHFKAYQKNSTGYIVVDEDTCEYSRFFINDLAKIKIVTSATKLGDLANALKKKPVGSLYKIVVEDFPEKLIGIQKWSSPSIRIEPKVLLHKDDVSEKVKTVLDQSLTIDDILYRFLYDNYKEFSLEMENELRRSISG